MKSISFPNMFSGTHTNLISDYDATLQNIKLLLASEKGELFGDPYFGAGLKRYLYNQNDSILRDILIDDIYTAIALFIPQVIIDRKNITIYRDTKGSLVATIQATNRADFVTNLYNIVLMQVEV